MAGEYVNDNTLTVYIKRLREKIEEDPQNPQIIKTVGEWGIRWNERTVEKQRSQNSGRSVAGSGGFFWGRRDFA